MHIDSKEEITILKLKNIAKGLFITSIASVSIWFIIGGAFTVLMVFAIAMSGSDEKSVIQVSKFLSGFLLPLFLYSINIFTYLFIRKNENRKIILFWLGVASITLCVSAIIIFEPIVRFLFRI